MSHEATFPHLGTLLQEVFLEPMDLSAYQLAKEIGVLLTRITALCGSKQPRTEGS